MYVQWDEFNFLYIWKMRDFHHATPIIPYWTVFHLIYYNKSAHLSLIKALQYFLIKFLLFGDIIFIVQYVYANLIFFFQFTLFNVSFLFFLFLIVSCIFSLYKSKPLPLIILSSMSKREAMLSNFFLNSGYYCFHNHVIHKFHTNYYRLKNK